MVTGPLAGVKAIRILGPERAALPGTDAGPRAEEGNIADRSGGRPGRAAARDEGRGFLLARRRSRAIASGSAAATRRVGDLDSHSPLSHPARFSRMSRRRDVD
ncbi:hypothetical protein OJF2_76510 [Aquisphaera giovannonii]|uniref:Uncharacterized protein n=1 Tax=Aquisphaera giovannonii TaxID=406548 RepID=A0A5B9WFJ9_9BACT|nr:hypothetical protein OJF2_76510 [Aquisphaera giovannonii]